MVFTFDKLKAFLGMPYPITVVMMFLAFMVGFGMSLDTIILFDFLIKAVFGFILMFAFIGAFNTWNAISDIESDRISKPWRPLPSGRLTIGEAKLFAFFLYFLSIALFFLFFEFPVIIFALFMILISIVYSKPVRLKNIPLVSDLIITTTYSLFPLTVGWGFSAPLQKLPFIQFFLIFIFSWVALVSKNFEDFEADKIQKTNTIIVLFGLKRSLLIVLLLLSLFLLFLLYFITIGLLQFNYIILSLVLPSLLVSFRKFSQDTSPKRAFSFFSHLTITMAAIEIIIFALFTINR